MKAKFLFLDTDFNAKMKSAKIKEGKAVVENCEFFVDKARPFLLETKLGVKPLYLVKWDSVTPLEFEVRESEEATYQDESGREIKLVRKELVPMNETQLEKKYKILPQILQDTINLRFLRAMKRYAEPKEVSFSFSNIMFLLLGAILVYILFAMKILRV